MKKEIKFVADNANLMEEWNWTKNQELALKHTNVSYESALKVWWICQEGHEWQAVISSRKDGRGCPICYKKSRSKN